MRPTADGVREPQNRRVELGGLPGQASTDTVTAQVIDIVKSMTGASHEAAFREVLRSNFDLPCMGRLALGAHWNEASEQQQARFLAAVETAEVRAYTERLGKLAGCTLTIAKVVSRPNGVRIVDSLFSHTSGLSIKVEWEVRDNGQGPRITDVRPQVSAPPDKAFGVQFLYLEQWWHGRTAGQRTGSPHRPPMKTTDHRCRRPVHPRDAARGGRAMCCAPISSPSATASTRLTAVVGARVHPRRLRVAQPRGAFHGRGKPTRNWRRRALGFRLDLSTDLFYFCSHSENHSMSSQAFHRAVSENNWRDPDVSVLDERRGPVPAVPLGLLPQPWRDWVADTERATGAPADHILQSVLAGIAAVCGAGVRVRVTPAWD
ncbi:MAG TPA: ABC transporter substrate-binding protein, partial [Reyranella sp.]|nr:ABC transporter substrate-binding protein [Reyranella sp.]